MGDLGPLLWANKYRKINVRGVYKKFSISREPFVYPFLKGIYNSTLKPSFKELVVKKPTQIGLTELAVNTAFYFLDTKGENVIYMLPSADQLRDFAHARLNHVIKESNYIARMFQDIDNVGLKVGKTASLYLRGANSESKLEEVPAGLLVRDEYTYMPKDNAKKAKNRLDASAHKWILDISHPRYPGEGIDKRYEESTRQDWLVECEGCGARQKLTFPESVDQDKPELICKSCGEVVNPINGEWSGGNPDNPVKGFHLSQLLSPTVDLEEIVSDFKEAKSAKDLRLFYNNRLGLAWTSSESKLSSSDVRRKIRDGRLDKRFEDSVMGVDVAESELFYWIQAGIYVLEVGRVDNFEDLEELIERFSVSVVVVDKEPETRRARKWGEKIRNYSETDVWLCLRSDKLESEKLMKREKREVKVNKTEQLDEFFWQFTDAEISLPYGLEDEVINHLLAPKRVIEESGGQEKARWKKNNSDFPDAGSYAKLAQGILEETDTGDSWKTDWKEDESAKTTKRGLVKGNRFKEFDPRDVLLND